MEQNVHKEHVERGCGPIYVSSDIMLKRKGRNIFLKRE